MAAYPLTGEQKDFLRSLVEGLTSGQIDTEWIIISDRGTLNHIKGWRSFNEVWSNRIGQADFDVFIKYRFFINPRYKSNRLLQSCHLDAGFIINVVENDFEIPDYLRPSVDIIQTGDINNSTGVAIGPNTQVIINQQAISPVLDRQQFDELKKLIDQLNDTLFHVPEDKSEEAEVIAETMQAIVEQVQSEKPNKRMLNMNLEGLRKAASDVRTVAGLVVIADQIAHLIKPLL